MTPAGWYAWRRYQYFMTLDGRRRSEQNDSLADIKGKLKVIKSGLRPQLA